jgi:hypothetical protein
MGGGRNMSKSASSPLGGRSMPQPPPSPTPFQTRMAGQIPSPTPVEVAPESYADTQARVAKERENFLKGYKRPEAPKKDCPPGCSPT